METTSQKLCLWTTTAAVMVFAIHIFMGVVVDFGNTGASMTAIDQLAFPTTGLTITGIILLLIRARIRINTGGAEARNPLNKRSYPWIDIYGLSSPKRSRWARSELPDSEFVSMLMIQSANGSRAAEGIRRFYELEDEFMPKD